MRSRSAADRYAVPSRAHRTRLQPATWTDAERVEIDFALLPVGSTEQHGPHAPLGHVSRLRPRDGRQSRPPRLGPRRQRPRRATRDEPVRHSRLELVREDRADEAADGAADGWDEWVSGVNLTDDAAEFSENGTVGDPREGGPERGARLLDEASAALVELLDRVATRER